MAPKINKPANMVSGLFRSVYTPLWPLEPFQQSWSSYQRGFWGERAVARALYFRGFRVVAHRWTAKDRSDIDLIMANSDLLLMLEVKLRGAQDDDPFDDVLDEKRVASFGRTISDYLVTTHQPFVSFRIHAAVVTPKIDAPRKPAIQLYKNYLNPDAIAAWRGNLNAIVDDELPDRL